MAEENRNQSGAESGPGSSATDASFDVSLEIKKLQEQAEKYKNEFLYARAEFDNYKRHVIKERSELIKYGAERVVRDLLGVIDNFERALEAKVTPDNYQTFKQGVEMTAHELKNLLHRHGVTEVPAEGLPFDPNIHEAISSEVNDAVEPGSVGKVFQKAYKLHDKLVRPAQVAVAKKSDS